MRGIVCHRGREKDDASQQEITNLFPTGVEVVLQFNYVTMIQSSHDLQFTIFEPLVLQDSFDGHHFGNLLTAGCWCQC